MGRIPILPIRAPLRLSTNLRLQNRIKSFVLLFFRRSAFEDRDDGVEITIKSYRGTLTKEHLGYIGDGTYYYKSASVSIVQK